uniref:Uncharacterized protein n=1 Tax=Steinernema glaseri TaxID=37863 RepID=A0A1I7YR27_9BILA
MCFLRYPLSLNRNCLSVIDNEPCHNGPNVRALGAKAYINGRFCNCVVSATASLGALVPVRRLLTQWKRFECHISRGPTTI